MMAAAEPNPPSGDDQKVESAATGHISGDLVMGDKNVSLTAGGDIVLGNKITNISNIYQALSWGEAKYQRNRQAMIQNVRDIWVKGVLEHSLLGAVLIQLGLEYKPEDVEQPWNLDLRPPGAAAWLVPAGTRKIDLFDQANGALLILGQPGAGKTTTLLELARDLLERAEQNPTAPVPVIFSLTSWAEKRPPLADWLAEELLRRYDVPRRLGRAWVDEDMLIPLLDGLDEVQPEQRQACLRAINAFRTEHGLAPLVVCSRIADYESLSDQARLRAAVLVQPLTPAQVDAHLARFGAPLAVLRRAIQEQPHLCELAGSPLMLSVMMIVYQGQAGEIALSGSAEAQRARLFGQYVERMLDRADEIRVYGVGQAPDVKRAQRPQYSRPQTLGWLSWLARAMKRHSQTIVYLEWIQPSWLRTPRLAAVVTLGTSALVGVVLGLLLSDVGGGLLEMVSLGLAGGLMGGIIRRLVAELGEQAQAAQGSQRHTPDARPWRSTGAALVAVLGGLVVLGLFSWLATDRSFDAVTNLVEVLGTSLVGGLIAYSATITTIETLRWARQGARAAFMGALKGGAIGFLGGAPIGWPLGLYLTVTEYGTDRGPIFVCGGAVIMAWIFGLMFGAFGGLAGAGVGWLRGSIRTAQLSNRRNVNQGIWRSARSALVVGLPAGLLFGAGAGLLFGSLAATTDGSLAGLTTGLNAIAVVGGCIALMAAVAYGGRALIQHTLLRFLLWRSGATPAPWRYVPFLDYAADRVLLRKVGGGYIFIHPLLMDYLAGLHA